MSSSTSGRIFLLSFVRPRRRRPSPSPLQRPAALPHTLTHTHTAALRSLAGYVSAIAHIFVSSLGLHVHDFLAVPTLVDEPAFVQRVFLCHLVLHTCMWATSMAFHLFNCVSRRVHDRLLRADLAGLCLFSYLGYTLPAIQILYACDARLRLVFSAACAFFCLLALFVAVFEWRSLSSTHGAQPAERLVVFGSLTISGILPYAWPLVMGTAPVSPSYETLMLDMIKVVALLGVGGGVYALHLPERFLKRGSTMVRMERRREK